MKDKDGLWDSLLDWQESEAGVYSRSLERMRKFLILLQVGFGKKCV